MLPWGLDQGLKSNEIKSESFCSDSMLQNCLKDTNCRNDYRVVFLQVVKVLGTQNTALLTFAKLADNQAGKGGSWSNSHKNIKAIITALGQKKW